MGVWDNIQNEFKSWGIATCKEGFGYIMPANDEKNEDRTIVITGENIETIVFTLDDVESVDFIVATSKWIKYVITLKNDSRYIATINVSNGVRFFEWWFADFLYKEDVKKLASNKTK